MSALESPLSILELIGDRIAGLQEYAPEPLRETAERLGVAPSELIKLDANENPYGPTDGTARVLAEYSEYHRYPDPISRRLRAAIGSYVHVGPEQILVGNGSDELIDLILRLFRPDARGGGIAQVIDCQPSFGMYAFYGATNDMQVIDIPRRPDFLLDMPAIENLCRQDPQPRIIFVASPNNPDGQLLPASELRRLLGLPLLIVLDEAYVEFAGASRARWVTEHDNLIVLRTFSKWAGLAGLRVGYGVFPTMLMPALWRLKSPYNVNGPAQEAAQATLADSAQALQRVRDIVSERERLFTRLQDIPLLEPYPSTANYILCRVHGPSLGELREQFEARGILIRYYGKTGLENCVRITVGTAAQNDAVINVLTTLSAS